MKKGEITRRLNLLAGSRPALPGHHHLREESLRLELAECFKPVNAIEMLWVADIAYCTSAIELLRVQVAGLRMYTFRRAYAEECRSSPMPGCPEAEIDSMYLPVEQDELAYLAEQDFQANRAFDFLARRSFAMMAGNMTGYDIQRLRQLQQVLHDETRERDRLVNQIDRRRRQAMRDAIELAEARQRAADYEAQCKAREEQGGAATAADNAPAASCITTIPSPEGYEGVDQEAA